MLVTDATGYVAGWLIKLLLEDSITLHAAVRTPDDKKKTAHLNDIAAKSKGSIRYFKSDLIAEGSCFDAMRGCELAFHTASLFTTNVKNPQKELYRGQFAAAPEKEMLSKHKPYFIYRVSKK